MIQVDIPGYKTLRMENLIMDFNGTIALDGRLKAGVEERLVMLSKDLNLFILTADTFGLVEKSCAGLPVHIQKLRKGGEADQKKDVVMQIGCDGTAAMGNGANDIMMLEKACLSIAILGQEGLCASVLSEADICVPDPCAGLDLFLFPKRIIATLRR